MAQNDTSAEPGAGGGEPARKPAAKAATPPPGATSGGFGASPVPAPVDKDFDAVGFGSFGADPSNAASSEDDTPSSGVYIGGEEVQVIDAGALGRALAQAQGLTLEDAGPKIEELRRGLVGIDLGASLAVIARFNEDGKHEVVPNEEDELGTPAHVFFDEDGERLVGREALRLAPSAPERAFLDVKVNLGEPGFQAAVGETTVDAEEVLSTVTKRLLGDVERATSVRPTHAALAAPAWFTEPQREALRRAVTKAGVEVVGVADESLAATVPYSLKLEDLNPRLAAVFDLGHSALGCAIVRCARGDIEVVRAESRRDLGATRWDDAIADEAARHFQEQHGFDLREDKAAYLDLRLRSQEAKKALSQRMSFTVVAAARGKQSKVVFSRPTFEDATRDLVDEARKFFISVRETAGVGDWSSIDAVIVTGGGTRMPMVRKMIKDETRIEPEKGVNPDEGVAIGALYWGLLARSRVAREALSKKTGTRGGLKRPL